MGIIGGYRLSALLLAFTEKRTREEVDELVGTMTEFCFSEIAQDHSSREQSMELIFEKRLKSNRFEFPSLDLPDGIPDDAIAEEHRHTGPSGIPEISESKRFGTSRTQERFRRR